MDGFVYGGLRVRLTDHGGVCVRSVVPERDGGAGEAPEGGEGEGAGNRAAHGPDRDRPAPAPRAYRVYTGAAGTVLGRDEHMRIVRGAVRTRGMVEFTAESGGGKTALLRAIGPDAYIRVGKVELEDVLQTLVREFYEHPPGAPRLSTDECHRLLQQVSAVVALDDVPYDASRIAVLRDALSGCAVLVGAEHPAIGSLGRSQPLPGLAVPDALALLTRELGRMVAESELTDARRLVAAVAGRPLPLRQAAALARHEGRAMGELARVAAADRDALDRLAISLLDADSRRALAVLALLAGAHLPGRLVTAMAGLPPPGARFGRLHALGLVEQRGDRFGLSAGRPEPYLRILDHLLDLRVALRALGAWIEARDPTGDEAREAATAAVPLLGTAAGRGAREALLPVAFAAERVLLIQGHWKSWSRVLDLGRDVALGVGDLAAQAHFAHQQGTLHLLEGRHDQAQDALSHALELRTRLGDQAGAETTRGNLDLAVSAAASGATGHTGPRTRGAGARLRRRRASPGGGGGSGSPHTGAARPRGGLVVGAAMGAATVAAGVAVAVGVVGPVGFSTGGSASGSRHATSAVAPRSGSKEAGSHYGGVSGGPAAVPVKPTSGTATAAAAPDPVSTALQPLRIGGTKDYGDVHAGEAGATQVSKLTIINPNDTAVPLSAITLGDTSDFQIATDSCHSGAASSGAPPVEAGKIGPDTSCTVSVRFAPATVGARTDVLTVSYPGGKAAADLTGRAFATVRVTIAPGQDGRRHGRVDVTVDGATTTCDQDVPCTVRYYDQDGPLILKAHGDQAIPGAGATPADATDTPSDTGGDGAPAPTSTPGVGYGVGSWTGPCTGAADECDPAPGGDVTTTVHFAPD